MATERHAGAATSGAPRPRRADAERNIARIVAVARDLLGRGVLPSMSEVAAAAGIGRVTLYAHFASREALVEAVVASGAEETGAAFEALGLDGTPVEEALARLIRTSWPILDRYRKVHAIALSVLGPETLRERHDAAFRHVERLIGRGQADGTFRTDVSQEWLVASFYALLHAAAEEVEAGRLDAGETPDVLIASLGPLLRSGSRVT